MTKEAMGRWGVENLGVENWQERVHDCDEWRVVLITRKILEEF